MSFIWLRENPPKRLEQPWDRIRELNKVRQQHLLAYPDQATLIAVNLSAEMDRLVLAKRERAVREKLQAAIAEIKR